MGSNFLKSGFKTLVVGVQNLDQSVTESYLICAEWLYYFHSHSNSEKPSSPSPLFVQLLQLVESDSSRLDAFLKWKLLEPVYWHWMVWLNTWGTSCVLFFWGWGKCYKGIFSRPFVPAGHSQQEFLLKRWRRLSLWIKTSLKARQCTMLALGLRQYLWWELMLRPMPVHGCPLCWWECQSSNVNLVLVSLAPLQNILQLIRHHACSPSLLW